MTQSSVDVRKTRKHAILSARETQITRNLLAEAGGGDYINARLSRFPSESNLSWTGNVKDGIASRADRSFLINYAGRVVKKIIQYVFGQGVSREGVDAAFGRDCTNTGTSLTQFTRDVAKTYLAGGWAWIGIDRGTPGIDPVTGLPGIRSIADRAASGDRVFWSVWSPMEVVDWAFGKDGSLLWLITEESQYVNEDPTVDAVYLPIRTLWERGRGVRIFLDSNGETTREEPFVMSAPIVPFVLIGTPKTAPHWFDDVERIQAGMLNLESAHHENLIKSVFPQLVIPANLINHLMSVSGKSFAEALELVRGIEYPLMEPTEDLGLTRLIMPSSNDLKAIPDELTRRRTELFEIVGQALRDQGAQAQSAASKAWDHRDVESTLADNAEAFEEAEIKAIEISKALDTSFKAYTPVYPRKFNLPDLESDWKILMELEGSGGLPESIIRMIAKVKVEVLDRIYHLDAKVKADALAEIEDMDIADLEGVAAAPFVQPGQPQDGGAGGDQGDDPGADDQGGGGATGGE